MSVTNSPGIPGGQQFKPQYGAGKNTRLKRVKDEDIYTPDCLDSSIRVELDRLSEMCTEQGIEVTEKELNELGAFSSFVASKIKLSNNGSVHSMVLWAEWVRFFLKNMNTFPELIFENEFRDLITALFGFEVTGSGECEPVYPGIEFVSRETNTLPVTGKFCVRA